MQFPSGSRVNNFNDYQNQSITANNTKKFHYANTPQKNKY